MKLSAAEIFVIIGATLSAQIPTPGPQGGGGGGGGTGTPNITTPFAAATSVAITVTGAAATSLTDCYDNATPPVLIVTGFSVAITNANTQTASWTGSKTGTCVTNSSGVNGTNGSTGATGATGPSGPSGPQGNIGSTGPSGPSGTSGTGTSVTNTFTGSESNNEISFVHNLNTLSPTFGGCTVGGILAQVGARQNGVNAWFIHATTPGTYTCTFSSGTVTSIPVPIACVGTPGNTGGPYRSQCQATGGALYLCNNSAGCTVALDWIPVGGSAVNPALISGLNNVLTYAPGISVNDGSIHTIGTAPTGTPFNGVTTLAGIAAILINGAAPFAWITSQSSPFAFSGSVYNLTNAKVPNIDIAWLAIQAALLTGKTYVPAGTYIIGSALPLPLYIPLVQEGLGVALVASMTKGEGQNTTILKAGSDFGAAIPLVSCGDPAGTSGNSLGRYASNSGQCSGDFEDIALYSSATNIFNTIGATPIAMIGFAWGARLRTKDILSAGFAKDWSIVGDHTMFIRAHATGGAYGFYWDTANSALLGDLQFLDLSSSGTSIADIGIGNASISASFEGETYLGGSPYGILGVTGNCANLFGSAHFFRLFVEFIGNAFIADDNGFAAGSYTDGNKCRNMNDVKINTFFGLYDNTNFWAGGRGRRASFDVNLLQSVDFEDISITGGQFSPAGTSPPSGPTPFTTFNANGVGNNFGGLRLKGDLTSWITQSAAEPLVTIPILAPGNVYLEQTGQWTGTISQFGVAGNYATTTAGDVMEYGQSSLLNPGGTNGQNPAGVAGVVMQSGLTDTKDIPIARSGVINTFAGWDSIAWALYRKSTGVRGVNLTAGTGYTNGTYTSTSTGGGCSTAPVASVTVSGGGFTAYTITTVGKGCTSSPTFPLPGGAGAGSGGVITAQWPAAQANKASSLTDLPLMGAPIGFSGSSSAGTEYVLLNLTGLQ